MSHYYVVEPFNQENGELRVEFQTEISKDEFDNIAELFWITGTCHSIDEIMEIVIENGLDFKKWMEPNNLQSHRSLGKSAENLILISNKRVLNYVSSIKTFIDIATRLIKQTKPEKNEQFHSLTSKFYDNHMEYRFWANFRNYVVHCAMPYTGFKESLEKPCEIVCFKEDLLKFDNWKHSRADIENFSDEINLVEMVDEMNSLIYMLYLDFYYIFSKDILDATNKYAAYLKKYNCNSIMLFTTEIPEDILGGGLVPLPIDRLNKAIGILQTHPKWNIIIS